MTQLLGLSLLLTISGSAAFDSSELALFDLVEEVNGTFYQFLDVNKDASVSEIKRAYRKLSLTLHPDRNKDKNAEEVFRQLAAIYEVLKDETLRQRYNDVLEFGLPSWRQPIFYYRQLRKMGTTELMALLVLMCTVGHYLILWAHYFEQMLVLDDTFAVKLRKKKKKLERAGVEVEQLIEDQRSALPKPTCSQLLPILFTGWTFTFLCSLPSRCSQAYHSYLHQKEQQRRREQEEAEEAAWAAQEALKPKRIRVSSPQVADSSAMSDTLAAVPTACAQRSIESVDELRTGSWTTEELSNLIRLSSTKYPVGTLDRWEKLARALRRKVDEVTDMVGELKRLDPKEYQKLAKSNRENEAYGAEETESKPAALINSSDWSANQQKCLEQALILFPKTCSERWESIAKCVPGKTKEECITRYKEIASKIRQKKNKQVLSPET